MAQVPDAVSAKVMDAKGQVRLHWRFFMDKWIFLCVRIELHLTRLSLCRCLQLLTLWILHFVPDLTSWLIRWGGLPLVHILLLLFTSDARPETRGSRTVQRDQERCRFLRLHGHHLCGQVMQEPLYFTRQEMHEPPWIIRLFKICFSFTVVSYALKFSEFGIDGAERWVC